MLGFLLGGVFAILVGGVGGVGPPISTSYSVEIGGGGVISRLQILAIRVRSPSLAFVSIGSRRRQTEDWCASASAWGEPICLGLVGLRTLAGDDYNGSGKSKVRVSVPWVPLAFGLDYYWDWVYESALRAVLGLIWPFWARQAKFNA
ncbi:hypothetical protein ACLB2K_016221 [Fragaria x ananassa]